MKIDEAIETIECFFRENGDCDNAACEMQYQWCKEERDQALQMAISALRAQQEKNEPCEACDGATMMYGDFCAKVSIQDTEHELHICTEDTPDFKFCPMCGRRLAYRHPPKDGD